jgi:hypothetical protein
MCGQNATILTLDLVIVQQSLGFKGLKLLATYQNALHYAS